VDLTAHAQLLVDRIQDRSARIGVVGLGYVGLPTAVAYADVGFAVMGWSLTDAYQRVLEVRSAAAPTDGQLATLRSLGAELAAHRDAAPGV
jgi:UDP-N-acetyl-D-mannosaminuronate dehydrogenase